MLHALSSCILKCNLKDMRLFVTGITEVYNIVHSSMEVTALVSTSIKPAKIIFY